MKYLKILYMIFFIVLYHVNPVLGHGDAENSNLRKEIPFTMPEIKAPRFPSQSFTITDFGAVGDGCTMNTDAIASTIDACAQAGGGRVIVPAGIWLTGPIHLQSGIDFHLQKGALLLFSSNFDDYPLIQSSFEGTNQFRCTSPINVVDLENIAITGQGIIDGSGDAWRPVKKFKMTDRQWRELQSSGGVVNKQGLIWWPTQKAMLGEDYMQTLSGKTELTLKDVEPARDFLRPVMVRLVNSKNILLDGPTFQNSPAWNIHPLLCENMIIRNISVRNPWYSQNGDGIDLESCKNVLVYDCKFDVGDDAICLKSGKDEFGRRRGRPTENIVIYDCTVYHGHGGITTGSEMSGGVHNIFAYDCTFIGTDIGLRFKSVRGRGGIVENLYFQDIQMLGVKNQAILFDLFYQSEVEENLIIPSVDDGTPIFQKIYFKDITSIRSGQAIVLQGLPEFPLRDIVFSDVAMSANEGIDCFFSENLQFKNTSLFVQQVPAIHLASSSKVHLKLSTIEQPQGALIRVSGKKSNAIEINAPNVKNNPALIKLDAGVDKNSVTIR